MKEIAINPVESAGRKKLAEVFLVADLTRKEGNVARCNCREPSGHQQRGGVPAGKGCTESVRVVEQNRKSIVE